MTAFPEGVPCWVDASFPDVAAAQSFYGDLFGWTFTEGEEKFGGYAQAMSDGKKVAGIMPVMPGQPPVPMWGVYFASADADASAARIREAGGRILAEPMDVADLGRMLIAQDPSGAVFGVWQPGAHQGFEKSAEPNSFCWTEVHVRDTGPVDAFYEKVLPITARQMGGTEGFDYRVWEVGGNAVAGRNRMGDDFPAEVPSHIQVYFDVADCDDAVATVTKLGGSLVSGPHDSPFGRMASVADPQGAGFAVIDTRTTAGEPPA